MQRDISLRQDLRNARPPTDRQRRDPLTATAPAAATDTDSDSPLAGCLTGCRGRLLIPVLYSRRVLLDICQALPTTGGRVYLSPCVRVRPQHQRMLQSCHSRSLSLSLAFSLSASHPNPQVKVKLWCFSVISPINNQTIYYILYIGNNYLRHSLLVNSNADSNSLT